MKTSIYSQFLASTLAAGAAILLAGSASAQTFSNIHNFAAIRVVVGGSHGNFPQGGVVVGGTELYGTTFGGASGYGEVFKMTTAGASESSIHSFAFTDGANPQSLLVLSGPNLYGTTYAGGANGLGVIFVVSTNATPTTLYTNLHSFSYADGANPFSGLVLAGNTLYGTTVFGGLYGGGSIFSINTNGTDFTNLYSFSSVPFATPWTDSPVPYFYGYLPGQTVVFSNPDGYAPLAPLAVSGGTLYGTTSSGGATYFGTIFSISTNGSGFSSLYSFSAIDAGGANVDGADPYGGVVVAGSSLFGTAQSGGTNGEGSIFEFDTNTLTFTPLWSFQGGADGAFPLAGPTLVDGVLYGTAFNGGTSNGGSIFQIGTNAGSIATEVSGAVTGIGGNDYYFNPLCELTTNAAGNLEFGTVFDGNDDDGAVFSFGLPGGAFTQTYHSFSASALAVSNADGIWSYAGLTQVGNFLYGTASSGGKDCFGCIFKVNVNGTQFTNIYNFTGGDDGAEPMGGLLYVNGLLYGTAAEGGADTNGTVFSVGTNGTGFVTHYYFTNGADGARPVAGLVQANGTLYGTAFDAGLYGYGTVFSIPTNGTETNGFNAIHNFAGEADGANPAGTLLLNNGVLYGTALNGGSVNNDGAVFEVTTNGATFADLYAFSGPDGANPQCQLAMAGSNLFGVATSGGADGSGTVFELSTNVNGALTTIYSFTNGFDGFNPQGQIVSSGGVLYGTAQNGGIGDAGTVFQVLQNGSDFTTLASFDFVNGAYPQAGVMLAANNTLYGTTIQGGSGNDGAIFNVVPPLAQLTISIDATGTNTVVSWPSVLLGFTLESTTYLARPLTWTPVSSAPVVVDGSDFVTNPIVKPALFFTLVNTNQ